MVAMVPEARVVALNGHLRRERAAHWATRRMFTAVLLELFGAFELQGAAKWSDSRGCAALDAWVATHDARAAAAAAQISVRSLYIWRSKSPSLAWRGKVAGFAQHWRAACPQAAPAAAHLSVASRLMC
jgi:hypothetical protein